MSGSTTPHRLLLVCGVSKSQIQWNESLKLLEKLAQHAGRQRKCKVKPKHGVNKDKTYMHDICATLQTSHLIEKRWTWQLCCSADKSYRVAAANLVHVHFCTSSFSIDHFEWCGFNTLVSRLFLTEVCARWITLNLEHSMYDLYLLQHATNNLCVQK